MYGENPFLIINNKLFLPTCQSLILIFAKSHIVTFYTMGELCSPLSRSIAGGTEDVKTAVGEAAPVP